MKGRELNARFLFFLRQKKLMIKYFQAALKNLGRDNFGDYNGHYKNFKNF